MISVVSPLVVALAGGGLVVAAPQRPVEVAGRADAMPFLRLYAGTFGVRLLNPTTGGSRMAGLAARSGAGMPQINHLSDS